MADEWIRVKDIERYYADKSVLKSLRTLGKVTPQPITQPGIPEWIASELAQAEAMVRKIISDPDLEIETGRGFTYWMDRIRDFQQAQKVISQFPGYQKEKSDAPPH